MSANYWLFKSEPSGFSLEDLANQKNQVASWDGVRNYQARNFMQQMKLHDLGFFYHSSCKEPGIYGIVEVVREAYPDHTAFDLKSKYYDPKTSPEAPRWFMVDVQLKERLAKPLLLEELREYSSLDDMILLRRGNRLSVFPVSKHHWNFIIKAISKG